MNLVLYYAPGGSSMAPHIALHEVGAPFEGRAMSFKNWDMRTPAFKKINPVGQVPTLLIDGRVLTEVAGILFYLARAYPSAGLLPDDIEGQAQVVSWMSFIAATVHPARAKGPEESARVWALAETRLAGRDWCVGDYSIADIHLFRLFWRYANSLRPPKGSFPGLEAHYERMMARPAVIRTIAAESAVGYELPA